MPRKAPYRWEQSAAKLVLGAIIVTAVGLVPACVHVSTLGYEVCGPVVVLAELYLIIFGLVIFLLSVTAFVFASEAVGQWIYWCISTPPADDLFDTLDAEGR